MGKPAASPRKEYWTTSIKARDPRRANSSVGCQMVHSTCETGEQRGNLADSAEERNQGESTLEEKRCEYIETLNAMETKLKRIAWLSGQDSNKEFNCLMRLFEVDYFKECFHKLDWKKAVGIDGMAKMPSQIGE